VRARPRYFRLSIRIRDKLEPAWGDRDRRGAFLAGANMARTSSWGFPLHKFLRLIDPRNGALRSRRRVPVVLAVMGLPLARRLGERSRRKTYPVRVPDQPAHFERGIKMKVRRAFPTRDNNNKCGWPTIMRWWDPEGWLVAENAATQLEHRIKVLEALVEGKPKPLPALRVSY